MSNRHCLRSKAAACLAAFAAPRQGRGIPWLQTREVCSRPQSDAAAAASLLGYSAAPMRVLLTGGSGFVGSYVAEQLAALGHTVRALVRPRSDSKLLKTLPNVEFAPGAIEDRPSLDAAVRGQALHPGAVGGAGVGEGVLVAEAGEVIIARIGVATLAIGQLVADRMIVVPLDAVDVSFIK